MPFTLATARRVSLFSVHVAVVVKADINSSVVCTALKHFSRGVQHSIAAKQNIAPWNYILCVGWSWHLLGFHTHPR